MSPKESKTAQLENKTSNIEKRLMHVEHTVGLNEDGTRNGNGLIHKIDELKNKIEGFESYIDNLSADFIKIDHRIEKLETIVKETNEDRLRLLNEVKEEQKRFISDIKDIKKSLEGNITVETLQKFQKTVIGIASFITAVGTIIGAVLYFAK